MDRAQLTPAPPGTPGRYAMQQQSDPQLRGRSPAGAPQLLRHSSSFGNLHGNATVAREAPHTLRRQSVGSVNRNPSVSASAETVALMARVHSVSKKADALLLNAGRTKNSFRGPPAGSQYPSERLVDLTERLARLETLLDEVAHVSTIRPGTARFDNEAQFSQAQRTMSFPSSETMAPQAVSVQVHGPSPTPRSSGRFIEVASTPGLPSMPSMVPSPTPPVPIMPMPGNMSPAMPPTSFRYGYGGNFSQSPQRVLPTLPNPPSGPYGYWQVGESVAQATPRSNGYSTPRVGSRAVGLGNYMGTPGMQGQALGANAEPFRQYSAPRPQSVPPVHVRTTNSFQPIGPPVIPGTSTPGLPPPPGLMIPSLGQIIQNTVDTKIRRWLRTIPIGNGSDRGWDDAQISEIAAFAQDHQIEQLNAEDIYKKYVEHQVETAIGSSVG